DGLIPSPEASAESSEVAKEFHNSMLLKGQKATLKSVKAALPTAGVFHFTGHSLAAPERTGLVLEDKNPLTGRPQLLDADSVRPLKMPKLRLAVLSACSTAGANGGDSSEFNSVTGAFLRNGVPHVVASRWAVDAVETRRFVEDFYANLLSGESVPHALHLSS